MSSASKTKGSRVEREIRDAHLAIKVPAKKMPLSGMLGGEYRGDLLIAERLRAEVKARKNGTGFTVINAWLGDNDLLFLRENNELAKVVMPWGMYQILIHAYCTQNGLLLEDDTSDALV